jgi:phosphoesterase RecJ-like protein
VADLVKRGIDTEQIHRLVYDTYSENRMRLLGYCLSERMVVLNEMNTAYIWLTQEDLAKFSFSPGDTEGVVNYALSIKNVSFAALFTEKKSCIRISFRSKNDFSVNEFAKEHFQGGGHRNASGGDSYLNMEETLKKFTELLPRYSEELKAAAAKSAIL